MCLIEDLIRKTAEVLILPIPIFLLILVLYVVAAILGKTGSQLLQLPHENISLKSMRFENYSKFNIWDVCPKVPDL